MYRILCFVFLLFQACSDSVPGEPPVDLDALAPLVADMQLAEGLATEVPIIVRDSMREVYFERTLSAYGSNRAEFDSLLWLVRQEPRWVDSLYSRVGVIITRQQAEMGTEEKTKQ